MSAEGSGSWYLHEGTVLGSGAQLDHRGGPGDYATSAGSGNSGVLFAYLGGVPVGMSIVGVGGGSESVRCGFSCSTTDRLDLFLL